MTAITTIGGEPARIDIELRAGEAVDFTVPVFDGADAEQDVDGWTIIARVTTDRGATTLHTFTVATDDEDIRISATGAQTAAWSSWPVPSARWSLWLTPPAGEPYPFAAGWVRVRSH